MKKLRKHVAWGLFIPALLLSGCSSSSSTAIDDGYAVTQKKLNDLVRIELTETQKQYVTQNNVFALNLFKGVANAEKDKQSYLVSPLSVTYLMGMVNNGAAGDTQKEINDMLGFGSADAKAINEFCQKLMEGAPNIDKSVQIKIANLVEVNKNYTLKPGFKNTAENAYKAQVESADFAKNATLDRINNWCKEHTNNLIPKILEEIEPSAVSYLLNAIYFKGIWTNKFDVNETKDKPFRSSKGVSADVPTMHQKEVLLYNSNDVYATLHLPYGNGGYSMEVLLPNEGKTTADVIEAIGGDKWIQNLNGCRNYEVDVELPKFDTNYEVQLNGILRALGAKRMFEPSAAEFPNFCNTNVYISTVLQKAAIKVNEEGSEAAAVTVGGVMTTSTPEPVKIPTAVFHANRPFIYAITENVTGSIYFIGVYGGDK